MKKLTLFLFLLFLSACSELPPAIQDAPSLDISYQEAVTSPKQLMNASVRWGGKIIEIETQAKVSILQIMAYPLNSYGKPMLSEANLGRFIVRSTEFLDPAAYGKDREITVAGVLTEPTTKFIGPRGINFPTINASKIYLWPDYDENQIGPNARNPNLGPTPFGSSYYRPYPYRW